MGRLIVGLVAALCTVFPAIAHAGTAEAPPPECEQSPAANGGCHAVVTYIDDPSHRADLAVTSEPTPGSGVVRFSERGGGTVTAGFGCSQVNEHEAVCEIPVADHVIVRAFGGDEDDHLGAGFPSAFGVRLDGGAGADSLSGSRLDDTLVGGPGQDYVYGDEGDDLLVDGDRGPKADQLRGGRGVDTVSYAGRPDDVHVDLHAWRGGAPGEGDLVSGNESARGGNGNDVLFGSSRRNLLDGGPGDDLIVGRRGDDLLLGQRGADTVEGGVGNDHVAGNTGRDRVAGGPGDDRLYPHDAVARDNDSDEVRCDAGADAVVNATVGDLVEPDCENVGFAGVPERIVLRLERRRVGALRRILLPCGTTRCVATRRVIVAPGERRVRPGTVLGESVDRGGHEQRAIRLSAQGARIARAHRGLLVRITFVVRNDQGAVNSGGFTTRLTLRR